MVALVIFIQHLVSIASAIQVSKSLVFIVKLFHEQCKIHLIFVARAKAQSWMIEVLSTVWMHIWRLIRNKDGDHMKWLKLEEEFYLNHNVY